MSSINLNLSGKGFYCVSPISVMKMNRTGKQRQKKVASTQDEESEEEVVSYLLARYLIRLCNLLCVGLGLFDRKK
jgi:hypothetical protein